MAHRVRQQGHGKRPDDCEFADSKPGSADNRTPATKPAPSRAVHARHIPKARLRYSPLPLCRPAVQSAPQPNMALGRRGGTDAVVKRGPDCTALLDTRAVVGRCGWSRLKGGGEWPQCRGHHNHQPKPMAIARDKAE
jgi:hypothetical protein